jgi:DNA end-binding protein Ku
MARPLWKGSISFGLVTVPIGLVSAIEAREELAFNLLHKKDSSRIVQKRFCKEEDVEVRGAMSSRATSTRRISTSS